MTAIATHSITMPPRFAADIEEQVFGELFEMGYGRVSITERDLPGLHFPKAMHIGPGYIKLITGTRATVGSNLFAIPIPYINDEGIRSVNSRENILLQSIRIESADRKEGRTTIEDPETGESYTLDVVLDPEGPDLRSRFARLLHQAAISKQVARSRSPLRRIAHAIGL